MKFLLLALVLFLSTTDIAVAQLRAPAGLPAVGAVDRTLAFTPPWLETRAGDPKAAATGAAQGLPMTPADTVSQPVCAQEVFITWRWVGVVTLWVLLVIGALRASAAAVFNAALTFERRVAMSGVAAEREVLAKAAGRLRVLGHLLSLVGHLAMPSGAIPKARR